MDSFAIVKKAHPFLIQYFNPLLEKNLAEFEIEEKLEIVKGDETKIIMSGNRTAILKWGIGPKDICLIREEEVMKDPKYRILIRTSRCIIPASFYFSFNEKNNRYLVYNMKMPFLCLAGIFSENGFAIITTNSNARLASLHPRMPLILRPTDASDWFSPKLSDKLL